MRSARSITVDDDDERYVQSFDLRDIDCEDPFAFFRLAYLDRINRIIEEVARWAIPGARVADVGCAQGNLTLLLAEAGYRVDGYDINPSFLRYAAKKWERGDVTWTQGNFLSRPASADYDVVLLGEVLEHIAHPRQLLASAAEHLRPGGYLVATTPNGSALRSRLPSYSAVVSSGRLSEIEQRQYGPGGEDHLFLYRARELKEHLPPSLDLLDLRFVGSLLYCSYTQRMLHSPVRPLVAKTAATLNRFPGLRSKFASTLLLVARKSIGATT